MSDRTPVAVPKAPDHWQMSRDQLARVAQDPRLHKLSRDELYLFFNPPQAPVHHNVLMEYANRALQYLGAPPNWLDQAFAWHPANTIGKASDALSQVNDGDNQ